MAFSRASQVLLVLTFVAIMLLFSSNVAIASSLHVLGRRMFQYGNDNDPKPYPTNPGGAYYPSTPKPYP